MVTIGTDPEAPQWVIKRQFGERSAEGSLDGEADLHLGRIAITDIDWHDKPGVVVAGLHEQALRLCLVGRRWRVHRARVIAVGITLESLR